MKKIKYWLLGFSLLVLVQGLWVSTYYAQIRGGGSPEPQSPEFVYPSDGSRNPFVPLFLPTPTQTPTPTPTPKPTPKGYGRPTATPTPIPIPDLELGGIFWDVNRPMAIINNQMVRPGESVSGVLVTGIEESVVYMRYLGRVIKLERTEEYKISID